MIYVVEKKKKKRKKKIKKGSIKNKRYINIYYYKYYDR